MTDAVFAADQSAILLTSHGRSAAIRADKLKDTMTNLDAAGGETYLCVWNVSQPSRYYSPNKCKIILI